MFWLKRPKFPIILNNKFFSSFNLLIKQVSSKDIENEMLLWLKHPQQFPFMYLNPLSPRSNSYETSPYDTNTSINKGTMTVLKIIYLKLSCHLDLKSNSHNWFTRKCVAAEGDNWPFNSHERSRQNFSIQYQYNIKQISDENKEKYQFANN